MRATLCIGTVLITACATQVAAQDRFSRVEDAMAFLGERIIDARFDTLSDGLSKIETTAEKSADAIKVELKSGLANLHDEIAAVRKQLQILTIVMSSVAGGGLLGGGGVYWLKAQGKTPQPD